MQGQGVLVSVLACVAVPACSPQWRYVQDRSLDFMDCFSAQVGYGAPASFRVQFTEWVSTGVGLAESVGWGFEGCHVGKFFRGHVGIPLGPIASLTLGGLKGVANSVAVLLGTRETPYDNEPRWFLYVTDLSEMWEVGCPDGHPRVSMSTASIIVFDLLSVPALHRSWKNVWRASPEDHPRPRVATRSLDVAAELTIMPLSVRVRFSPGEFIDFLAGLVLADPAGDSSGGDDGSSPQRAPVNWHGAANERVAR